MRSLTRLMAVSFSVALLLASGPPVKMGLWEMKRVTTVTSVGPTTVTSRSCVTPETWEQMASNITKQQKNCTMNTVKNDHGYTFKGTCTMGGGIQVQMNGSSTIEDSEHIASESHSIMTMNGQKRETNSRSTSHFISSSCGSVKPGEPELDR